MIQNSERIRLPRDDRREMILGEAIRIIGEQGYRNFGLRELARRCGLTNAGLLHHFGSKDGLLIALLKERDRQDELAITASEGLAEPEGPLPRDKVFSVLRAIVARNARQVEIIRLFTMLRVEALSADHPAHDYFNRREAAAIAVFGEIAAPHVADARSAGRQIAAMMTGLEVQWLREDCGFDLVAEWDKAATRLLQA
jgi:AcrR family transcriptional regulator